MKPNKLYGILMAVILMIGVAACETFIKDYSNIPDRIAPGAITDPSYTPIPGGVTLHYTLPKDDDLMGIKAVYTNERGEELLMFASGYIDSLTITGIGNTDEREVKIIVVDNSNNESVPVPVLIIPGQPEIANIGESIVLEPFFGGIKASWENPTKSYVAMEVSYKDASGNFVAYDSYYSNAQAGKYEKLGKMESVPTEFSVYMRDRWGNKSEVKNFTITPDPSVAHPYIARKTYFPAPQLQSNKYSMLYEFTYEVWVKAKSFQEFNFIMGVWSNFTGTQELMLGTYNNGMAIWGFVGVDIKTARLELNQWAHLAVTYNGSSYAMYLNGELKRSASKTGGMNLSTGFYIGGNLNNDTNFNGEVRDVRVWSVTRTQEEIIANMCGVDPNTPGLIANWKLDEGRGMTAKDSSPNHYDIEAIAAFEWNVSPPCGFVEE